MATLNERQADFVSSMYEAAAAAGLYGAQADLAVTQAIHETGWGRSPSGRNNYHGIKDFSGRGTMRGTWEVENGRRVNKAQPFANYDSLVGSFKGWKGLMERVYPDVMRAKNFDEALLGLNVGVKGKPNYATDPRYNSKINAINERIGANRPQLRDLQEFARQNEIARDVEGLFGAPVQQSPSILEGFDILSNVNWSGVPTPTAKPAQNVPTPTAKPAAPRDISPFAIETPERASQRPGARDFATSPVDIATAAPVAPVERGILGDLAAPAREFTGFGMNTPERASQREQQQEQGAPRGLLDGFGDLSGARSGIADVATSLGQAMGRAPEGYQAPRDVGMLDFAGLSAPTATPAAVPDVAAGPVLASATGRVGPGINPTGFASATISAPTRNDRASAREQEQEDQGINFGIDAVPTDRTTLGLLGQLGAPEAVVQRAQERERARQEEEQAAALQAPMQAPPQQAAPAMPAMAPARNIASMPTPQGPGSGPAVTVPGAVPEVAAAVNRYGLDPDPGPGRAYGYSPWGSGVSIGYDTAPDRVRDAGTGPGLFGAFNDAFGVDLTPSPGFMTGPIAMGLDAAGGAGLFSLGNMLGGSRSLVDRMDVVDRATRDRIDGPRDEGSNRSGGLLGGFLSDPLGSAGRQARSELGTLGGLFGWGGDTRGTASAGTSGSSSGGGFLSGLGDILGGIFGGYEPATERDSRSGSMGGVGSASARGFY